MNAALVANEILCAPESCDVNPRFSSSGGKSRAEKGQSFADSAPLAKVKAEQEPDADVQTDENDAVESQPEQASVSPTPTPTPTPTPEGAPVKKTHGVVAGNQNRYGGNGRAARGGQPEPKTEAVANAESLAAGQIDAVAQQMQVVEIPDGQADEVQALALVSESVQNFTSQLHDAELPPSGGQLPPEFVSITTATKVVDAVKAQLNTSLLPQMAQNGKLAQVPESIKGVEAQVTASGDPVMAMSMVAQKMSDAGSISVEPVTIEKVSAELVNVEKPPAGSALTEIAARVSTATGYQQPVRESQTTAPTSANPVLMTETQIAQSQEGVLPTPGRTEAKGAQGTSMEGLMAATPESKGAVGVQSGQDISQELSAVLDTSSTGASRGSAPSLAAAAPEMSTLKSASPDIAEQIGSALRTGLDRPDKQLTVRLQPPELGTVVVRLEQQGQEIRAVLEVSRSETGREIEQALPQVIRNLQEAGLQVRKFDVVVSDQLGKDTGSNSSSHNPSSQQQAWSGAEGRQDGAPRSPWSSWNVNPSVQSDSSGVHDSQGIGSRGGIDLLV